MTENAGNAGAGNGGNAGANNTGGAGAAGNTGGAGSAAGAANQGGGAGGRFDWGANGFAGDDLTFVQNKGWEGPKSAVESYRNLEKVLGAPAERIIRLPEEPTPENMGPIYEKLGRPQTPDGYKLPVPEGESGDFAKTAAGWFHEAGIPAKAAEFLAGKWNEHKASVVKQTTAAQQQKHQAELDGLKSEWGAGFDQHSALVDRTAVQFGMSSDQLMQLKQVMGPAGAMRFLHSIGVKMGVEDVFTGGEKPGGGGAGMTPAQAQARIAMLSKDRDFGARLAKGEATARAESERLHRLAYPEG